MALSASRRTGMILYTRTLCPYSHRTRIVLREKNIGAEVVEADDGRLPEDVLALNPYGALPTWVERDLVLYDSHIIMEYLDERYPHPPLLPVDMMARAQNRLYFYRVERDWYALLDDITGADTVKAEVARKVLRDELVAISPMFEHKPYFMSDQFTLVDCALAPLLWRLPAYGIELPSQARAVLKYADRLFSRPAFRASLTEAERALRT